MLTSPCGWLTNVVTQKLGILAMSSDLFWKNGWRSLLYFCSTFKISSLACSFSLQRKKKKVSITTSIYGGKYKNEQSQACRNVLPVNFVLYFIDVFDCFLLLFF